MRRTLKAIGWTVGAVVTIVLLAVAVVLWTPWGTRTALEFALTRYDGAVAGGITVGAIDGTIGGALELTDLSLVDGNANPLIAIDHLRVDLRLLALARLTVAFDTLAVDGLAVHVGGEQARFGDLGPDTPPKPKPEGMVGPDLPIGFEGALVVDDLVIHRHLPDGSTSALVHGASLRAHLSSKGREATLRIDALAAELGAPELTVAQLAGKVTWADPEVRIADLFVLTDRGLVRDGKVGFDAYAQSGDAIVHALVDVAAIAPDTKLPIEGTVAIDVDAAGDAEHAWATIAVGGVPEAQLDLVLGGSISPQLDLAGVGIAAVIPPNTQERVVSLVAASVMRAPEQPMLATVALRCIDCRDAVGANVSAEVTADGKRTKLEARAFVADATVNASATIRERVLTRAHGRIAVPAVQRVRRALAPWIPMPEIEGSALASASCDGRTAALDCTANVDARRLVMSDARIEHVAVEASVAVRHGEPTARVAVRAEALRWKEHAIKRVSIGAYGGSEHIDVNAIAVAKNGRAHVIAGIDPGARTRIGLTKVALDLDTLHARLVRPSRLVLGKGMVAIHDLRLAVDRGVIAIDGEIGSHSDARVAVEHFDLASLAPLKLPVRLAGVVEARAEIYGRNANPDASLILDASRLQIGKHRLGRFGTEVALEHGRVDARVRWDPAPDESLALRARGRLRAFDDARGVGLVATAPLHIEVDAEGLELVRIEPLLGSHAIDGQLDASLRIDGTAKKPVVLASVDARGLEFDETRVDAVHAEVKHDRGRVELALDARAPWLDAITVAASLPVRVTGVAPYYAIDRRGSASVDVMIDAFELVGLQHLAPALGLEGRIDGEIVAAVDHGEIETAHAALLVRDIVRDGERIATLALDSTLTHDRLRAEIQASGPAMRLLEAKLDVPMQVDVDQLAVRWLRHEPHALAVELAAVDLAAVGRLARVDDIAGHVDGSAALAGPLATPVIDVALRGHGLAWAGHPIGRLAVDIGHRNGHVRAAVRQSRGVGRIEVDADVPLRLDIAAARVHWDRDAEHTVDLDAVAVDEQLLAAFVALPEGLTFEANAEVHARGHSSELAARGRLRAEVGGSDGEIPTPVAATFVIDPELQRVDVVMGPFDDSAVELSATATASIPTLLAGGKIDWRAIPITLKLDADEFPLHGLAPLMPDTLDQPEGRLNVHFAASGVLGSPELRGRAQLHDASITVVPMRQRFDHLTLDVALDHQDIRLNELSARSGPGRARAKGKLHLARGATAGELEVVLDGLAIVRPGLPLMKVSTRVVAKLDATGKRTELDVVARRTTLDVFTESATAPAPLPTTENIVFVDNRPTPSKRKQPEHQTTAAKADDREPVLPPDMHVRMTLADPLYVRGPQANMTWRGEVVVERAAGEKVTASGALIADRGRINFLGRDFVVDSGRVTLPEQGDIDPYISLIAITQTEEGEVTIDVHGRASRPELRLSSDPPLPESDVFALLVTGSSGTAQSENGEAGAVEAKAASVLAAFQNPVLQQALQDRVGIDRVGVSFGDSVDQPIVALGKRVSRKIYLETRYHHNAPQFENNAEIHLEYTIKAPSWTVETFIGDAAKGGVEVWWRKRFGGRREPRPTAMRPR